MNDDVIRKSLAVMLALYLLGEIKTSQFLANTYEKNFIAIFTNAYQHDERHRRTC
ncbi:MAG: hypothetical protein PHF31_15505 [Methylobacter sp.]|nr:hypothetical protein [Methylobacter sp.]